MTCNTRVVLQLVSSVVELRNVSTDVILEDMRSSWVVELVATDVKNQVIQDDQLLSVLHSILELKKTHFGEFVLNGSVRQSEEDLVGDFTEKPKTQENKDTS